MGGYIPGVWSQRYQQLPPQERDDVKEETNRLFRERTGVSRTLDPQKDHALANRWLRIRDEVLSRMAGKATHNRRKTSKGFVFGFAAPMQNYLLMLLYNYDIGDSMWKEEHGKALDGAIVPLLKAGLDVYVGVQGFASRTGGESENKTLSQLRADFVDAYLRRSAAPSVNFFRPSGAGEKEQMSKDPAYRDAWPQLESIDEDERDRSVLVRVTWQLVRAIAALSQAKIDWNEAFEQAAPAAALEYALGGFIKVTADYAPSPSVKGLPVGSAPDSFKSDRPDADAVLKAMKPRMIRDIKEAAAKIKLNITDDEIESKYQEWLNSSTNTWK
jgi:outer membrane protein OmpA-like peptidoglycan-associated protein